MSTIAPMEIHVDLWLEILKRSDPYTVCRFSQTATWAKNLVELNARYLPRVNLIISLCEPSKEIGCLVKNGVKHVCRRVYENFRELSLPTLVFQITIHYYGSSTVAENVDCIRSIIELVQATSAQRYECIAAWRSSEAALTSFHIEHVSRFELLSELCSLRDKLQLFLQYGIRDRTDLEAVLGLVQSKFSSLQIEATEHLTVPLIADFVETVMERRMFSSTRVTLNFSLEKPFELRLGTFYEHLHAVLNERGLSQLKMNLEDDIHFGKLITIYPNNQNACPVSINFFGGVVFGNWPSPAM